MQVYVNAFTIKGSDAGDACQRAIHGWLSQQVNKEIPFQQILEPFEISGSKSEKSSWLKSYSCPDHTPAMHAWRLKHGDDQVSGRQWTVEIGLALYQDSATFSCSVQTDEQSTRVQSTVSPTRPRLIGYILDNVTNTQDAIVAPETPGNHLKRIGGSQDEYRALLHEIQNPKRDFPIVLVSSRPDGEYLIKRTHLQDQLFGLAQVVELRPECDTYEMTDILGSYWSAWNGAVNVIRTPHPSGRIIGTPVLSEKIQECGETQSARIAYILGLVTHNTNVPRLRNQIRPDGVMTLELRKRFQRRLESIRQETGDSKNEDVDELLEEVVQLEEAEKKLREEKDQAELSYLQAEEEKEELNSEIRKLRYLTRFTPHNTSLPENVEGVSKLALSLISEGSEPSPSEALELIEAGYGDSVVILDSAKASADDFKEFSQGRRLFDMLKRLVTDYKVILSDKGDAAAKDVFTKDEFASKESETVRNSKELMRYRTFNYNGVDIEMPRHLKIGKADDMRKTIRVHFAWDSENQKIVIGYCGKHLPVSSH